MLMVDELSDYNWDVTGSVITSVGANLLAGSKTLRIRRTTDAGRWTVKSDVRGREVEEVRGRHRTTAIQVNPNKRKDK